MSVHFKVIGAHGIYANGEGHSIFFKELLYLQQCVKLSPEQCPRLFKYKLGYFAMRRLYCSKIFSWLQIIILSVTRKRIFISIFLYMVINMYSTLKKHIDDETIWKNGVFYLWYCCFGIIIFVRNKDMGKTKKRNMIVFLFSDSD